MSEPHNIVFIDVETDGLDANRCHLLEVACIVTDQSYVELGRYQAIIYYSFNEVSDMIMKASPVVQQMHTATGLWDDLSSRAAKMRMTVEHELWHFLTGFGKKITMPIGGNSVALDQAFINKHLPLAGQYLDYHMRDVSSIAAFAQESFGVPWKAKKSNHTAMTDVEECIAELVYYRDALNDKAIEHQRWRYDTALGLALRTLDQQQGVKFLETWNASLPES